MDRLAALDAALTGFREVVVGLDDSQLGLVTNCDPWTVRQLVSHAVSTQLFWVGVVTGEELVTLEDTMAAVAYEGELLPLVDDAVTRARTAWRAPGALDAVHAGPSGDRPGSSLICFPIVDAFAHSWDLAVSVGRSLEFPAAVVPAVAAVIDETTAMGLFTTAADPPGDATATERLMAATGRSIPR